MCPAPDWLRRFAVAAVGPVTTDRENHECPKQAPYHKAYSKSLQATGSQRSLNRKIQRGGEESSSSSPAQ